MEWKLLITINIKTILYNKRINEIMKRLEWGIIWKSKHLREIHNETFEEKYCNPTMKNL